MDDIRDINYWDLRKLIAALIPRSSKLLTKVRQFDAVREKGRKRNYQQYNLLHTEWRKQERLLNTEEINSFLEISVRAAACPMPFNMDIWDGLLCPYNCLYCFANAFRASLYTAFFDNSKTMGYRHCNPTYYKQEMDKMGKYRAMSIEELQGVQGIKKAYGLQIPLRMGIRFEDFLGAEKREGVGLQMLQYLAEIEYPVMINTKSDLLGTDPYLKALSDNPAKSAVHVTLITSDNTVLKKLEPGAPSYNKRLEGIRRMCEAGIRVVARIEPYLFLLTDEPAAVDKYIKDIWEAGVRHITFDTYSYTALNPGIRTSIFNSGFDFDRMFLVGCDSQPLGSLLLGKFMELFRDAGFSCSSFDMGNVPDNDQSICCEVEDWFEGYGWNYGSTVMAARFIKQNPGRSVSWNEYKEWVDKHGGFLTKDLEMDVKLLWNLQGNVAYSHRWSAGLTPVGLDDDGLLWRWDADASDYRMDLLKSLI
jgi:DNA repair photolyase